MSVAGAATTDRKAIAGWFYRNAFLVERDNNDPMRALGAVQRFRNTKLLRTLVTNENDILTLKDAAKNSPSPPVGVLQGREEKRQRETASIIVE